MSDFVNTLTADVPPTETPAVAPPVETPPEETPPVETPPAEPPPAEPAKDDEGIPEAPKSRKDWDTLRASRDRHKQTAEETQKATESLKAEIEELRGKAARLPELEEKLKDLDEMEKELSITRLEATREYRDTILKPLQVIGEQAEVLANSNESEKERVYEMLRESDPVKQRAAFKELTLGWDEVDRSELWGMTKDARVILDKQDSMRTNASAAAKEQQTLAESRQKAEKEAFTKEFITSTKDVVKSLREKTPFVPLAEGELEDDRYASLEQKVAAVDFDAQPVRAKAFAAATAVMYPQMVKTMAKMQAEIDSLKSRVKADNATKPSVSPSEPSRAAEPDQDFLSAMGVPQNPTLSHSLNVVAG
jgi:uncharacterized protein with HEPN domain